MKSNFNERRQARIERYKELAEKNENISSELFAQSRKLADVIPFGQPILVGHHSEKGHRSHLKRIDNTMRKSVQTADKAEYYADKAKAAENNRAIFSDDPEAVKKLKEKIHAQETQRKHINKVNAAWRKYAKNGDDSALKALGLTDEGIQDIKKELDNSPYTKKQPYPSYINQNLSQNINRNKKRLAQLEKLEQEETTEKEINGVRVVDSVEDNRLQLYFPDKPSAEIRTQLKRNGFRWSPSKGCWQRHRSNHANYVTENILGSING
jgi:hypothetical protein